MTFNSVDELWTTTLRHLLTHGEREDSRDGDTLELVGYQCTLDAAQQRTLLVNKTRKLSAPYAAAELLWYLSGDNRTAMLQHYAPIYKKFTEPDGTAYGAYGPRAMPQLCKIVQAIKNSGRTRQAVVAIWRPDDLDIAVVEGTKRDLPCTLHWQFLARAGCLKMVVSMRSNDSWLGLPYDVFCFCCIQRLVAAELGLQVGDYVHQVGSMHLYARNQEAAALAMKIDDRSLGHGWELDDDLANSVWAVKAEQLQRVDNRVLQFELGDMLTDLVAAVAKVPTTSPDFQRLQELAQCDT